MRIAILSYGHFASIFPLAKSLANENHVCLYLMVNGKHFSESICNFDLQDISNGLASSDLTKELLDAQINEYLGEKILVRLFKYPNLRIKHTQNHVLSYKLSRHLKKESYDIVHFNGIKFFPFQIALFLLFKRIIWTIHDPTLHSGEENRGAIVLYRLLCKFRVNIIIHNHHSKTEFLNYYPCLPEKIHFLPYAPLEVFNTYKYSHIKPESKTILFFGRISKYKGLEYLIDAAKLLQHKIHNLKVIIAGDGKYNIDLEMLQNNPLFEIHKRFIPNKELVHFIQRCSVVVCPYTDATQSGVIMTAYAFSKPVIASRVGGISEVVIDNETGLLVPPKDAKLLAEAINKLLTNPALLASYSKSINKYYFTGEYSWKSVGNQLTVIYKQVIAK